MSARSILVFEANLSGTLDHGSARVAALGYGAQPGTVNGPTGNAYGIPTTNSLGRALTVDAIGNYLQDFLRHAAAHPDDSFRVSNIGQQLGPAERERLVELFSAAPENCLLPGSWLARFGRLKQHRVLIGGGGHTLTKAEVARDFESFLKLNAPLWGAGEVELVTHGPALSTVAVDRYAKAQGLKHRVIPDHSAQYGAHAALARDELALWYCTRVVSLTRAEETSPGNEVRIIAAAARAGIPLDEVYGY
jgi:hypothetical protein